MKKMQLVRGVAIGIVLFIVVVLCSLLRDMVLSKRMGDLAGYIVSSVIVITFTLAMAYYFVRSLKSRRRRGVFSYYKSDLVFIGIFWFTLTVLFELFFRRYVMGDPLSGIFAGYDTVKGGLLGLVLLTQAATPYLFGAILL